MLCGCQSAGSAWRSRPRSGTRGRVHALACKTLGIRHLRTRPYRPRTNGKAERFICTLIDGWAYGAVYRTSSDRTAVLTGWLDWYNRLRPHRSLGRKPPLTRLAEMNNLVGTNTAPRSRAMLDVGVQDEVRAALAGPISHTARQALGLEEIATLPRDEAFDVLVVRTRRYAAYQRKWMRRVPGIVMVGADRPPGEIADDIVSLARTRERLPRR